SQGSPREAETLLAEAERVLRACADPGIVPQLLARTREELRGEPPDGLTSREVEVLRFLATGLSDAQIAEKLVVSVRTVHAHVRSIYRKLGVGSRSAATRYALEHHLV
ncbi:MAG TPA: response regulator transcription factor, partial [Gaiellaceae bacterium]|nr:response regulator transcription factor [Gaiellaceae bacterium]